MANLFEQNSYSETPLADRMRPRDFSEFYGQNFLIGKNKPLRKMIETDRLTSIILWGPPGTGKTTIGRIVAAKTNSYFEEFSAVTSGVNDLRRVVKEAKERRNLYKLKTVLFVDEIHRFNKSQQDGFLPHIENGTLILVGATTENPGFEINSALLSRSMLFELKKLEDSDIKKIIISTITDEDRGLGKQKLSIEDDALKYLIKAANGDARSAINALEIASSSNLKKGLITKSIISDSFNKKIISAYKKGDNHYDVISAFIKSMRGSDPDAAIYWLARMIEAGEDPKFIARRMVVFASEDIGNAAPMALLLAVACFEAVNYIGLPEARINLAQCAIYLASAPKSNASYLAIDDALKDVREEKILDVPKHLKNAPTKFAKEQGYGKEYLYPHNFPDGIMKQDYLPENLITKKYYVPTDHGVEAEIKNRLDRKKSKK
ncbi:MAG: replication-associated recombination protein A [Patescibacteria group bacterium]|jgi:putative ATPase|nr:replication-associated recombination protein A [Patescibacteria group bacterium]